MTSERAQIKHFGLSADAIHIWTLPVSADMREAERFKMILSTEEAERASRFQFEHLRDAYVATHGALRILLGRYLDCEPAAVSFRYGVKGKPEVSPASPLHFNLSHSHGVAAVAIVSDCPVGLDIEQIRELADMQNIADRFFCAEEAADLLALPADQRERAFFTCWTRKEAFIKAIGDGLACPLDSFRVNILPGSDARLIHINGDRAAAERWTLHDLSIAPGFAATLAYAAAPRSLSLFHFDDLAYE